MNGQAATGAGVGGVGKGVDRYRGNWSVMERPVSVFIAKAMNGEELER